MTYTPLASSAQFNATAFSDLATNLQAGRLDSIMVAASRAVEGICRRRLVEFSGVTETQRLFVTDVEDAVPSALPIPNQAAMNLDYARALGFNQLVRHCWVREFPPVYVEDWTGAVSAITIRWSYGSALTVDVNTIQFEPDTGHVRFQLGTFVPPGSTGLITYSGGYTTVPDDLVQATVTMAASMVVKELDPREQSHDPDLLRDEVVELCDPYIRD